jgi:hypothetical protein
MVELAGTAPASARLSWLVVYRHRSFKKLRNMTDERPKGHVLQIQKFRYDYGSKTLPIQKI